MNNNDLLLHALAIKKHASPEEVAPLAGIALADASATLERAATSGRAALANGKYLLTPLARVALESSYSRLFEEIRENDQFISAYEDFERINVQLKTLITDWQTISVGGERIANDHSSKAHDDAVIDRLGDLHERADRIFGRLATHHPRLKFYSTRLLSALEKAEDGAVEWVSDAKIESYHTLWFELHEDLLRIMGRVRDE